MAFDQHNFWAVHPRKRHITNRRQAADCGGERKTSADPQQRRTRSGGADAGVFAAEIDAFRLHLTAAGKAPGTLRNYLGAVRWFAGDRLVTSGKSSWAQVEAQDTEQWMAWLLDHHSRAYARNQYWSLQQFFGWLAIRLQIPDPMEDLRAPSAAVKVIPVFTSLELSKLEKACDGRSFEDRRDAAIIAVFLATGIRLAELAGICHDTDSPVRSDLDLESREIKVRGKRGKERIVRISHEAARSLDRYIRVRARQPHAWRPELWLGSRGPLAARSIYQIVVERGRKCDVQAFPQRFRHHFSHTWLDRGGAEADLMALNGWTSPQMLIQYGAGARNARALRTYDRVMSDES
jgi:site-specific recombinase XerD